MNLPVFYTVNIFDLIKPYGRRASAEDLGIYILPQVVAPRNATLLDQARSPIVPAAAAVPFTPGQVVAFEYRVPANRRGTLRRLSVDAVDPAALPSLTFSVLRSSAPVPNYQLTEVPIGTIGVPDEVNIVFDGDQLMQVVVFNSNTFNTYEVSVRVVAHFWDVVIEWGR